MTTETTCRLDIAALTVFATDQNGQEHDLTAEGEPCKSLADLRDFVITLREQGLKVSGLLVEIDEVLDPNPGDKTFETTALRNGATEATVLVTAMMMSIEHLLKSDPIAFFELVEIARNGAHRPFGNTEEVLLSLRLIPMHPSIRNVVLSAVRGDGLGLTLGSPVEREGEELEREDEEAAEAEARDDETARQNDLWDAGAEARYQDELRRMARDDEARTS